MIPLLVQEGILSSAVLTGVFTNHLITSFKVNILDPLTNHLVPAEKLDRHLRVDDQIEIEMKQKDASGNIKTIHKQLRWQTFLKDLIVFILISYLVVKMFTKYLNKYRPMPPGVGGK
jgi:large-conductance mechanosensitive channel